MDSLHYTPKEIVQKYNEKSILKTTYNRKQLLLTAVFAGIFIAAGAQASSLASHAVTNAGLAKLVAGAIFPVGLMMIIFLGGELFTSGCMMSMAFMGKKISFSSFLTTLGIIYIGNFLGALLISLLISASGQLDFSHGALGAYTIKAALGKVNLSFGNAFFSGILCNILVCSAVLMAVAAKDITGKILAIFFPIMAFVISGFEHCIANMYYIPSGIFASMNSNYVQAASESYGITEEMITALNWKNFVFANLVPVTLGNIVGGSVLIGGICYYLYLKSGD